MRLDLKAMIAMTGFGFGVAIPCAAHLSIIVHVDAAGTLRAHMDFPMPAPLSVSTFPGMTGWASPDPSIESLFKDEPDEGAFILSPLADVEMVIVAHDPEIHIWRGGNIVLVGSAIHLGGPFFEVEPVWNITAVGEPGRSYSVEFMLRDRNGTHADGDVQTLQLAGVPECPDVNQDDQVDLADLAILLTNFGGPGGLPDGDVNIDGNVDLADLATLLSSFGANCP